MQLEVPKLSSVLLIDILLDNFIVAIKKLSRTAKAIKLEHL